MIGDLLATFATNQRPTFSGLVAANNPSLYGNVAPIWPIPFPDTYIALGGSPAVLDLVAISDIGNGRKLTVRIDITTSFGGTGTATNTAQFGIIVADDAALITNPIIIAFGPLISTAGLVAGTFVDIVLPTMPSIAKTDTRGRRYMGVILQGYVLTNDWTAGACTVRMLMDTQGDVTHHLSGYSMPGIQGA